MTTLICGTMTAILLGGITYMYRSSISVLAGLAGLVLAPAIFSKPYVVMGKGDKTAAVVAAIKASGGRVTGTLEGVGIVLAESDAADFESRLASHPDVNGVSEDFKIRRVPSGPTVKAGPRPAVTPPPNTEPFDFLLWNLRQIGADRTAAAGHLGEGAVVAVLDEGIIVDHEDIAPNLDLARSVSFVPGVPLHYTGLGFNHGTHVAGIIAAPINGLGVQGVAPKARIVAIRVLDDTGTGSWGSLLLGIYYAATLRVDVINMSLGLTFDRGTAGGIGFLISALNKAITHATQSGSLCVSAAGNEAVDLNSRLWSIPAQSGNGMGVSATGPVGLSNFERLASYSNYGRSVIDVAAPGGDFSLFPAPNYVLDMIVSPAGPQNGYYFAAGTSMAAPHVSGLAALIVGRYGRMKPSHLRSMIENYAVDILKPGSDDATGKGRIDAARTLGVQ